MRPGGVTPLERSRTITKLLDKLANLALIVGVAVFLFILFRDGAFRHKTPGNSPRSLVGTSVSLPGVQLNQNHNTVLLAISTTCHFCQESVPFYKELSAATQEKVDLIAVLPQSLVESKTFLQKAGVSAKTLISADLNSIGIHGTPTILLLDPQGNVKQEWRGFQDVAGQKQIIALVLR